MVPHAGTTHPQNEHFPRRFYIKLVQQHSVRQASQRIVLLESKPPIKQTRHLQYCRRQFGVHSIRTLALHNETTEVDLMGQSEYSLVCLIAEEL